jgi:hypothetical protein
MQNNQSGRQAGRQAGRQVGPGSRVAHLVVALQAHTQPSPKLCSALMGPGVPLLSTCGSLQGSVQRVGIMRVWMVPACAGKHGTALPPARPLTASAADARVVCRCTADVPRLHPLLLCSGASAHSWLMLVPPAPPLPLPDFLGRSTEWMLGRTPPSAMVTPASSLLHGQGRRQRRGQGQGQHTWGTKVPADAGLAIQGWGRQAAALPLPRCSSRWLPCTPLPCHPRLTLEGQPGCHSQRRLLRRQQQQPRAGTHPHLSSSSLRTASWM